MESSPPFSSLKCAREKEETIGRKINEFRKERSDFNNELAK